MISRIANNGKTPISINSWHNGLQNNNFQFNQPTTSDLYDVVAPQINGNNPPTTIDAWQSDFFGGFLGKYDPSDANSINYYTTIGIPDYDYQISNNINKPVLILPDPESVISVSSSNPIIAYSWNSATSSIIETVINDINIYYDLIDDNNFFVIALAYDRDYIDEEEVTFNCSENWQQDDGYCDGNCGENFSNSPNDCNEQINRKKLYLRKLRINEDLKDRNSGSYHEKRHWESLLAGKYEPSVGCILIHSNLKGTAIQKIGLEDIYNDNVKRSKKKKNGQVISTGTSYFIDAIKKDDNSTLRAVEVGTNFNPNTDKIFIHFSERTRKKTDQVPIMYNGSNIFSTVIMNTCMSSGKIANDYVGYQAAENYFWYSFASNNFPSAWVSESMTLNNQTQQVRVLKRYFNATNDVDFELYYLEDKYEW